MTADNIQHLVIFAGRLPPLTACGLDRDTVTHMVFGPPIRVDLIPPALARIGATVCPACAHACGIGALSPARPAAEVDAIYRAHMVAGIAWEAQR